MSHATVDQNQQQKTENIHSEISQKKIDPEAQLKAIENQQVDHGFGVYGNDFLSGSENFPVAQMISDNNVIQRRISNVGDNMASEDQNRELLVRSNDQNQFGYNLPGNMTYHHVIPRNKLADFWNTVHANREMKFLTPGIDALVQKAIDRIANTPDLNTHSTLLDINGQDITHNELMNIFTKIGKVQTLNNTEHQGADILEKIYQWWPANIHHGPTNRPTGINMEEDDGGNLFEISAKHVVKKSTYSQLKKMNDLIDLYITQSSGKARIKTLRNIKSLLLMLSNINSVTPFKRNKWYQVPSGTHMGAWRIKST